jgi:hypothetical protein
MGKRYRSSLAFLIWFCASPLLGFLGSLFAGHILPQQGLESPTFALIVVLMAKLSEERLSKELRVDDLKAKWEADKSIKPFQDDKSRKASDIEIHGIWSIVDHQKSLKSASHYEDSDSFITSVSDSNLRATMLAGAHAIFILLAPLIDSSIRPPAALSYFGALFLILSPILTMWGPGVFLVKRNNDLIKEFTRG